MSRGIVRAGEFVRPACLCMVATVSAALFVATVHAQDVGSEYLTGPVSTEPETHSDWTPERWARHVEQEKQRVQNLSAMRRIVPMETYSTVKDDAARTSEEAFQDATLVSGDIVVTTKGTFVFKGKRWGDRRPENFEKIPEARSAK